MSGSLGSRARGPLIAAAVVVGLVAYLVPAIWMVLTSLKARADIFVWPPNILPPSLTLDNYALVQASHDLIGRFVNSSIVTIGGATLATILGTMAAYGLARLRWPRRLDRHVSLWILGLRVMPPIAVLIPITIVWGQLHLVDTFQGLILAYVFFPLPLAIWLMYVFIRSVPEALTDAAAIDGANHWATLTQVVIPVVRPGIATTLLLSVNLIWNEFLFGSQLSGSHTSTLPVLIAGYIGDRAMDWGALSAAGTVSILPMIVLAVLAQRHIVAGLTLGAVRE